MNSAHKRRRKHKIFIGVSPGSRQNKMLEEAHSLKKEGVDVVIGLLETYNRQETADKAIGLELIPRKNISCSGVTLTERCSYHCNRERVERS